jgi:O-antigen ligase
VNPSWTSPTTIVGVLGAIAFAVICYTNIQRGIILFTIFGATRGVQVGAFSGSEMTQGLLPVELLATVLIVVWCIRGGLVHRLRRTSFNLPLFLLVPSALISLFVGFTWYDPTVAVSHMKMAVSIGQIAILVWVIGTYLVVANSTQSVVTIDAVRKAIVYLALPSLILLVKIDLWPYLEWSTSFALPASSLCYAEFFHTRSPLKRAALLLMTVAPVLYGYQMGKAFFYAYVLFSTATITWFMAKRMALLLAAPVFAAYVLLVPVATGSLVPAFLDDAVQTEEEQQSLGGDGGRDTLIKEGLGIWAQHPVFGVGPGNNYPYMLRYSTLGTAHNQFINILMEGGVIALAIFLWFAAAAFRTGLAAWRAAMDPVTQIVALGWLGLFVAMVVGGMFGDFMIPSIRNDGLVLFALFYVQWVLLGLVVSIRFIERGRYAAAA